MIKLLSTDFDGTLVDHFSTPMVAPELFALFAELRRRGVAWAVNTGRSLEHILDGLAENHFPFAPDYILTSERHVFKPAANGESWEDFGDWNARCNADHDALEAEAAPLYSAIKEFVVSETRATWINDATGIGLLATSLDELDRITRRIAAIPDPHEYFTYQRNALYLRFCHARYSKGAALGELTRLLALDAANVFAAGDHYNDISMLDGTFAKWTACPANAEPDVKAVVRASGGYVANDECSRGIVEALRHFLAAR